MAKIINTGGYPAGTGTGSAITSTDTHPADHPKPASGGGGTK